MSDTPRTDAFTEQNGYEDYAHSRQDHPKWSAFARTLERDLAASQAALATVPRLIALINEQHNIENVRTGGSFGIAIHRDHYAVAWQQLETERDALDVAIRAALSGDK